MIKSQENIVKTEIYPKMSQTKLIKEITIISKINDFTFYDLH